VDVTSFGLRRSVSCVCAYSCACALSLISSSYFSDGVLSLSSPALDAYHLLFPPRQGRKKRQRHNAVYEALCSLLLDTCDLSLSLPPSLSLSKEEEKVISAPLVGTEIGHKHMRTYVGHAVARRRCHRNFCSTFMHVRSHIHIHRLSHTQQIRTHASSQ
jgi:hypothetical protein